MWNWVPHTEGKERPKKEEDHSRLVSGRFNKQRTWNNKACLEWSKMSRSPHLHSRVLKVYIEGLTRFSNEYYRIPWTEEPGRLQSMGSQRVRHDWTTNTFTVMNTTQVSLSYSLKAVSLKMACAVQIVGRTYIPRTGEAGDGPLIAQFGPHPLHDLL